MEVMNISKHEFKKLNKFVLDSNIKNMEATFYTFESKDKWEKNTKILKVLYNDTGSIFSNKLFTLNTLIDNKDIIDIPQIIMPEKLVSFQNKIVGFVEPFIDGDNFRLVLNNYDISNKQKIEYFKQIGSILQKMKNVRENTSVNEFYLNDLHEENFIVNKETNEINVVDIDSCSIEGNKPFAAKYLTPFSQVANMSGKYHINNETKFSGFIKADENTDIYCYIIMILNFLYKDSINKLSIGEFYLYLNYLKDIGLPYELLDKFSKIYEYVDNENPYELLDSITDDVIHKARNQVFKLKYK